MWRMHGKQRCRTCSGAVRRGVVQHDNSAPRPSVSASSLALYLQTYSQTCERRHAADAEVQHCHSHLAGAACESNSELVSVGRLLQLPACTLLRIHLLQMKLREDPCSQAEAWS